MEKIAFKIEGEQFNKVELGQISEIILAYKTLLEKVYLVESDQKVMGKSAKEDLKIEIRQWKPGSIMMDVLVTASTFGMTYMELRSNDYSFSMLLEFSLQFILDKCSYFYTHGKQPKIINYGIAVDASNNAGIINLIVDGNRTEQEKRNNNPVNNGYYHNNINPETGEGELIVDPKILALADSTHKQFKKIASEIDGKKITSVSSINQNNPNHKFIMNNETTEILSPTTSIEDNSVSVKGKIHKFDTATRKGKITVQDTLNVTEGEYSFQLTGSNNDEKDVYINAMLSAVTSSDLLVYREIVETPSGKKIVHSLMIEKLIRNNQ